MKVRYRAEFYEYNGDKFVDVYDHQTGETQTYLLKEFWDKMANEFSKKGGFIYGAKDDGPITGF